MPRAGRCGLSAPIESVDIAPEPEAKIMIADMLAGLATRSCTGAPVRSGAETIHVDTARMRHTSR